jgi:hypothetical protein
MVGIMSQRFLLLASFPLLIVGIYVLWTYLHPTAVPSPKEPYTLTPLPDTALAKDSSDTILTNNIPPPPVQQMYLEITVGCAITLDATCVRAHSKPASTSRERAKLRIGVVLAVKSSTTTASGTWYEIEFPEHLRYADRLTLPWYIPAEAGVLISMPGAADIATTTPTTTKSLLVDRSDQKLYAYDDNTLVYTYTISTGLDTTPTPRGLFTVYRMTPSRYMQGPIPGISTNYYDLPGVPWNLYFTEGGAVVHGAYWHDDFGHKHSNGCVNLDPNDAKELYQWAALGMEVQVRD